MFSVQQWRTCSPAERTPPGAVRVPQSETLVPTGRGQLGQQSPRAPSPGDASHWNPCFEAKSSGDPGGRDCLQVRPRGNLLGRGAQRSPRASTETKPAAFVAPGAAEPVSGHHVLSPTMLQHVLGPGTAPGRWTSALRRWLSGAKGSSVAPQSHGSTGLDPQVHAQAYAAPRREAGCGPPR